MSLPPSSIQSNEVLKNTISSTSLTNRGVSDPPSTIPPDPNHTLLIFDLDNCLYPHNCGIGPTMSLNLLSFCTQKLGLTELEARMRCWHWYKNYGMSLHGLVDEFQVDVDEFDRHVDLGVPIEELLPAGLSSKLNEILSKLAPYKKTIFTNAQKPHAERVLKALDIQHHFSAITACDYSEKWFVAKPEGGAYIRAMQDAGVLDRWLFQHGHLSSTPSSSKTTDTTSKSEQELQIYFFDDNHENCLVASRRFGWHAIHIDEPHRSPPHHFGSSSNSSFVPELHKTPEEILEKARKKREVNDLAHPSVGEGREGRLYTVGFIDEIQDVVPELFILSGGDGVAKPRRRSRSMGPEPVPAALTEEELMKRAEEEGVEVLGGGLL